MAVDAAQKILSLAQKGLPRGDRRRRCPDCDSVGVAGHASLGWPRQDAARPAGDGQGWSRCSNVQVVAAATATGSQADDGNVPAALPRIRHRRRRRRCHRSASPRVQRLSRWQPCAATTRSTDTDYYYLFNPNLTRDGESAGDAYGDWRAVSAWTRGPARRLRSTGTRRTVRTGSACRCGSRLAISR